MIIPFPPGGTLDTVGRLLAQKLGDQTGQVFVVENRPGGNGTIGADAVAKAPADGYTLMFNASTFTTSTLPLKSPPYDTVKDFAPIALVAKAPLAVATAKELPVTDVKSLIAHAKANPGKLRFGSSEPSSRLAGEQFKAMTATDLVHVPYKGGSQIMTDMLGGHVQVGFTSVLTVLQHYKTGKLRVLGVGGSVRSPNMPDIPTVTEAGLPGYDPVAWYGMYGPKGMPKDVTAKIQQDIAVIAAQPDVKARLIELGALPVASTPEDFAKFSQAEYDKFAKLIKAAGIKAD